MSSNSTERTRSLRESRRAAGLCPQCGDREPDDGRKRCSDCLRVNRDRTNSNREAQILKGVCPACGGESKRKDITVAYRKSRRFMNILCDRCVRQRMLKRLRK